VTHNAVSKGKTEGRQNLKTVDLRSRMFGCSVTMYVRSHGHVHACAHKHTHTHTNHKPFRS